MTFLKDKMKKTQQTGLTVGLSIVSIFFLSLTIYRWTWDYNENGSYFNEETMTSYSDNALPALAVLTTLLIIPILILLISFRKAHNRQQSL